MKLAVIGLGQCGCQIADEFAVLNETARSERKLNIITAAFAVDTDAASLEDLPHLSKRYQSRIRIGGRESAGHGVGKAGEKGAEVAREDGDKVIAAMRNAGGVLESDACLLVASTGGGTGSGALTVIARQIKERFIRKPIYALLILPFDYEETQEKIICNTGICLKSVSSVADATILVSNQRFAGRDVMMTKETLSEINTQIVQLFYELLCAGEEKRSKYTGAKVLDTGDIMAALLGWTVVGDSKTEESQTTPGVEIVNSAMSHLSLPCNPRDASSVLYVLSAPLKEISMDLVKQISDYIKELAPNAMITDANYPKEKGSTSFSVVLSGLTDVEKVRYYYSKSTEIISLHARRQKVAEDKLKAVDEEGKHLSSY